MEYHRNCYETSVHKPSPNPRYIQVINTFSLDMIGFGILVPRVIPLLILPTKGIIMSTPIKVTVKIEGNIEEIKGLQGPALLDALYALSSVAMRCTIECTEAKITCGSFKMTAASTSMNTPNPQTTSGGVVVVTRVAEMDLTVEGRDTPEQLGYGVPQD